MRSGGKRRKRAEGRVGEAACCSERSTVLTNLGEIRVEIAQRKTLDVLVVEQLESVAVLGHGCERARSSVVE